MVRVVNHHVDEVNVYACMGQIAFGIGGFGGFQNGVGGLLRYLTDAP
ncbi:hypothetical protein BH24DEI2_BH24DEI2_27340 [soil metagenome]